MRTLAVLLLAGCASAPRPAAQPTPGHLRLLYGDGCQLDLELPGGARLVQQAKETEIAFAVGDPSVVVRAWSDAAGLSLRDFAARESGKEAALDNATAEKMGSPTLVQTGPLDARQVAGRDAFEFRERGLSRPQEETGESDLRIATARVESRQTFYLLDGSQHLSLSFRAQGSDLDALVARSEPLLHTLTFAPCK
jgi:hypothetical protein